MELKRKHKFHFFNILDFNREWLSLIIFIPKKEYDSITAELNNGEIRGGGINAKDLSLNVDNGKIGISKASGKTLEFNINNGEINLNKVDGHMLVSGQRKFFFTSFPLDVIFYLK